MSVDLRAALGPTRDQGQRGTCVAFTMTAAHEHARTHRGLSEEALAWGVRQVSGRPTDPCTFDEAGTALDRHGQPDRSNCLYSPAAPAHPPPVPDAGWHTARAVKTDIARDDLIALLDGGTPVMVAVTLFATFHWLGPDARILPPHPAHAPMGQHAVLLVGHGPAGYLVRNSWGIEWGDAGHATLTWDYADAHITEAWIIDIN